MVANEANFVPSVGSTFFGLKILGGGRGGWAVLKSKQLVQDQARGQCGSEAGVKLAKNFIKQDFHLTCLVDLLMLVIRCPLCEAVWHTLCRRVVLCDIVFGTCIVHFVRLFCTLSSVRCIVRCDVLYPMFRTSCIVHHRSFGRLRVRQRYPSLSAADKTKWSETA